MHTYLLSGLLKRLGADIVLDMGVAEDLALIEEYKEFSQRYQRYLSGDRSAFPMLASTCPGKNTFSLAGKILNCISSALHHPCVLPTWSYVRYFDRLGVLRRKNQRSPFAQPEYVSIPTADYGTTCEKFLLLSAEPIAHLSRDADALLRQEVGSFEVAIRCG